MWCERGGGVVLLSLLTLALSLDAPAADDDSRQGPVISGRVVDSTGRPIAGARVVASRELGSPDDDLPTRLIQLTNIEAVAGVAIETVTGSDGAFTLRGVERGHYALTALASGHGPATRRWVEPADGVDLALAPGSRLEGSVLGADREPIAGALVRAYPEPASDDVFERIAVQSRPPLEEVRSDASGRFVLERLGAGRFNLLVDARGHRRGTFRSVELVAGPNSERVLELERGQVIRGVVVDADGKPVAGTRVRVITKSTSPGQAVVIDFDDGSVVTGADGAFEFTTLDPGTHAVLAWHADHAARHLRAVTAGGAALKVVLGRGAVIAGRVTASHGGEPIAGCRVTVSDILDVKREAVTGEDGTYRVLGVTPGRGRRQVTASGAAGFTRESRTVQVTGAGTTTGVDFALVRNASVSGRVVSAAGGPVAGARVTVSARGERLPRVLGVAVTGEDGRYTVAGLEAGGDRWVSARHSDFLERSSSVFELEPGAVARLDDIVLALGGSISGEVVDARGRAIRGATVSFRGAGETRFNVLKGARSGDGGRFRLGGLRGGEYDLRVESAGFLPAIVSRVAVEEDRESRGVRVELRPAARLTGLVRDADGKPVAGARIAAQHTASSGLRVLEAQTDSSGRFVLEELEPDGMVTLDVEHADFHGHKVDAVAASAGEVRVTLRALPRLTGTVVDARGKPVPSFTVLAQLESAEDRRRARPRTLAGENGRFDRAIAPGSYTVSIRAPGLAPKTLRDIVVGPTGQVDVGEVKLEEGGVIRGVVIDGATKKPLVGCSVRVLGGRSRLRPGAAGSGATVTDGDGRFELRDLRSGRVSIQVLHADYVPARIGPLVVDDVDEELRVELVIGKTVRGTVLDAAGKPCAGENVYLIGRGELARVAGVNQRTKTDAKGAFEFRGLKPGAYRIIAHSFDRKTKSTPIDVDIAAGDDPAEVTLRFSPAKE